MTEFPWVDASGWLATGGNSASGGWVSDRMVTARRNRLDTARDWLNSGGSVLFFGPDGAGKTAALDVLMASAPGVLTLRYTPGRTGPEGPYAGLAGLLASVGVGELGDLPDWHREVLGRAVLRREPSAGAEPVGRALLDLLWLLGQTRPSLLVVDDLDRLDEPTADVLRFVAAHVGELPIQMIAAECVPGTLLPRGREMLPPPLLAVRLDALPSPRAEDEPPAEGGVADAPRW
jgi:AAA ATPase domain